MNLFRTKAIDASGSSGLKRDLNAFDLTMLGVGAIIGAGIFVLTGRSAATEAGPAIMLSFVIAGIACTCAALAYAELAAAIGGAGSAYSYGYAGFGELPGWIIGWMLLAEYALSVSTVAVGWSAYFNDGLIALGKVFGGDWGFPPSLLHGPFEGSGGIINLPASALLVALGLLLASGAKSSARFNAVMVIIKLSAIILFIVVAIGHFDSANWHPFIPAREVGADGHAHFGIPGVLSGAALVFFAYIGFDAVSTSAEETANPQRDLPIGIVGSLLICTVLYIIVSGLLTGIVPYRELNTAAPVSHALLMLNMNKVAGLISIGAIAGLTTVCLVMYYALTRLLFAISRDGLLPRGISTVSGNGSPQRIIVLVGVAMVLLAGLLPLNRLAELTNISTLAAFVVVCGGVISLRASQPNLVRPFVMPWSPILPIFGMAASVLLMVSLPLTTWVAFVIWMAIGFAIYFTYSYSHSALATSK
ncbi:MAG TPA: amino acid permease [Nevskiaceae bacterium]|nr:amino acid permease [Nevskiaceae bacterium]